ncbi:hypothetical protein L3Y34_015624 [Caenorhabditis briggsae]|uniref:Uncharacterized protein n=1 Tax=Caenorhabditis briggsae TaxID=6238 RepID=A0AAE9DV76_CAEBR|nr:hypothetical protein L3Y34_015624 [Caenorhabditis briggsae]
MVLNDSFSSLFSSPLRKANESFNESFGDKNTLSPATVFRCLQKEYDQISTVLQSHPPTCSQYQTSLNELISLFERAEDQSMFGVQKLILSVFLKLTGNILSVLGKPKYQPTLYKLAQLIASSISPDLGADNEIEEENMHKWADRIIIECSIHLLEFPNYKMDLEFNIDEIVDELVLASGKFQFVKSAVFVAARDMVSEMDTTVEITPESRCTLGNLADENILRLLLWLFLRQKSTLKSNLLPSLFPNLPFTLKAEEYDRSAECSLLDLKLYLVSLSVVSSTTTESGMTMKSAPTIASQLSLTKHQKNCWKAIVDACAGKKVAAISRLRTSQLVESVRLISDGSEDVRVLFDGWKYCLQPSATYDDDVYEAIQAVTEKYRAKMNSLLAYGPFYTSDPSSFSKSGSVCRRDMKTLFPLQFDYEFVNTTEAEHIGTVINSLEGYMSPQPENDVTEEEDAEVLSTKDFESAGDETFHSVGSTSDHYSSANNSQFFSPLQHNRDSMLPSAVSQLIREESLANTSHVSTKSLILTPTRGTSATPTHASPHPNIFDLSIERHQNVSVTAPEKSDLDHSDEEEDELEAALLESTQKHEKCIIALKTPEKSVNVEKLTPTPTKDAQTATDDAFISSGESSIVTVKYTPKTESTTTLNAAPPIFISDSEEYDDEEYYDEDEEEYYDEKEENDESLTEKEAYLSESEIESLMEQIREATLFMFRDRRMKMFGLENQKIQLDNTNDAEILEAATKKLEKISMDLSATSERLDKLKIPNLTTMFPSTAEPSVQVLPIPLPKTATEATTVDHNPQKCLGCQSDEIQESALRRLEQMANDWDAEGNDYLFK